MNCNFEMNEFCILCLNVDVKLRKLSIAQAIVIENILKLKEFDAPWENQCHQNYHVCSICLALLVKISNFMKMILNAQKILSEVSKTTDTITKPMLKSIDRCINGLNPLSVVSFGIFDNDEKIYDNQNTHQNEEDVGRKTDSHVVCQEFIKNCHKHKTDYNSTNEKKNIEIDSSSDEDVQEPLININFENDFIKTKNDPLEAGNKLSKNNNTTNDSLETIKKKSKQKKGKAAPQKTVTVEPESPYCSETESSSKSEEQQNANDVDYQPDSEDSDFDSYNDTGTEIEIEGSYVVNERRRRRKKKPQDLREYPRKCDHCDYIVMRKRDHYKHYLHEHRDIKYPYGNEKTYMCSICGQLLLKSRVKIHERNHYIGHYKCIKCPKVFSSNLRRTCHQYNVHGKNVYTCDYCSKSFKVKHDMRRHIRIHTGEKPFICHICGAGFAHSGNRSIHIRSIHQNIKYTKKQEQKKIVRENKKKYLTDTESESSGEQLIPKKRKRSIKQWNSKTTEHETEIEPSSKKQSKKRAKHTKKELQNKNDTTRTESHKQKDNGYKIQSQNSNCQNDNCIEANDDSDDECLAEKKKRYELESNEGSLHEEKTAKPEPKKESQKKCADYTVIE